MKKSVFRKVAIVAIAVFTMSVVANAQEKGDMAASGNLVLGSDDMLGVSHTNYGIGAKFQYNVTNPLRLEGSFTYFLKKDARTMWDLSANAHWLFPVADKITVYPLAGLGILNYSMGQGEDEDADAAAFAADDDDKDGSSSSKSDIALNLGVGIDFKLTEKLIFNVEVKYKTSDVWDELLRLSVGLVF